MKKLLLTILLAACAAPGPSRQPNEREWSLITADYQWIQTLRDAQKKPPANATRKQEIELVLDNIAKMQATYDPFIEKVSEYSRRTSDPRASSLLAREKIYIGDQYMNVLSRYDKALASYREALQFDAANKEALQRIATAEERRFVSMTAFASVKTGMTEKDVRRLLGLPREDWIKQVVQNSRIYSVWIYSKADGGASAVYFDNSVVYHTNWNAAAPPPAAQSQPQTQ